MTKEQNVKIGNSKWEGGVATKTKLSKGKYEAKLEHSDGWVVWIFSGRTQLPKSMVNETGYPKVHEFLCLKLMHIY